MKDFKYITSERMACEIAAKMCGVELNDELDNYTCSTTEDGYFVRIDPSPFKLLIDLGKYFLIQNDFEISVGSIEKGTYQKDDVATLSFRVQTAMLSGRKEEYSEDLENFLQEKANHQITSFKEALENQPELN